MQTWSISIKAKAPKSSWEHGTMNYNQRTGQLNVYNEHGEQLEQSKLPADRIHDDAKIELRRFVIEVGALLKTEENVEDLFAKLNEELGIEPNKKARYGPVDAAQQVPVSAASVSRRLGARPGPAKTTAYPVKVATPLTEEMVSGMQTCDILYTRDKNKKSKLWHDGLLRYYPSKQLAEFWDGSGVLLHKKIISGIKNGEMLDTPSLFIEIVGEIAGAVASGSEAIAKQPALVKVLQKPVTKQVPLKAYPSSTNSSAPKLIHEMIYTSDKQKKSKKWLDGRVEFNTGSGLALFYAEDSNCFYKRILPATQIIDDSEFESGQYIFIIGIKRRNQGDKDNVANVCETEPENVSSGLNQSPVKVFAPTTIIASTQEPISAKPDDELFSLLQQIASDDE